MPAPIDIEPGALAADEAHWARVGRYFARTEGIVNPARLLGAHGESGAVAVPAALAREPGQLFYARRLYGPDYQYARERVARLLGADVEEGADAERHGSGPQPHSPVSRPPDAVLLADVDYPAFKRTMAWLEQAEAYA